MEFDEFEALSKCKTLADFEAAYPDYWKDFTYERVRDFAQTKSRPQEISGPLVAVKNPSVPQHIADLLDLLEAQADYKNPHTGGIPIALLEITDADMKLAAQAGFWRLVENMQSPNYASQKAAQKDSGNVKTDILGALAEIITQRALGNNPTIQSLVTFDRNSKFAAGADLRNFAGRNADIKMARFESDVGNRPDYGKNSNPLEGLRGIPININLPKHYKECYPERFGRTGNGLDIYLIAFLDMSTNRAVLCAYSAKLIELTWGRQVYRNQHGYRDREPAFSHSVPLERTARAFDQLFDLENHSAGFLSKNHPAIHKSREQLKAVIEVGTKGLPTPNVKYEDPDKVISILKDPKQNFRHYLEGKPSDRSEPPLSSRASLGR